MAKLTRRGQNDSQTVNNFTLNLTKGNDAIKGDRARVACSSAERSQRKIIDEIIDRQDKLLLERENLSDLSPRNTTSLVFAGGNFDGDKWARRMQDIELQLVNIEVELEVAEGLYEKWFAPVEAPAPKATRSGNGKRATAAAAQEGGE